MGINGDDCWTDWRSQSDSRRGGMGVVEKRPTVELPLRTSCMVSSATAGRGETTPIMASQSLTSMEMNSVVKKGCCRTRVMTGSPLVVLLEDLGQARVVDT
jgi:hypothetical protein